MQQSKKVNVRYITFTAVMAALVFVFTFTFKIPLGTGYTHLGDMMIFLAAWLLGGKKAAPAAGLGACLADLALGYAAWMAPTFIIKFLAVAIWPAWGRTWWTLASRASTTPFWASKDKAAAMSAVFKSVMAS